MPWPAATWVVHEVVPAGAVSMGMPLTLAPGSDDGVTLVQDPAGPVDDASTTGPVRVAPAAAQFDPDDEDQRVCDECQVGEDTDAAPDLPVHDPTSQANPFPARQVDDGGGLVAWLAVLGGSVAVGLVLSWAVTGSAIAYLVVLGVLSAILVVIGGVLGSRSPRRQVTPDAIYFHPCRKCPARCQGHFR